MVFDLLLTPLPLWLLLLVVVGLFLMKPKFDVLLMRVQHQLARRGLVSLFQTNYIDLVRRTKKNLYLQDCLDDITTKVRQYEGDFQKQIKVITEGMAKSLFIERACVWLYDKERAYAVPEDLYFLSEDRHGTQDSLSISAEQEFFDVLNENKICADDWYFHNASIPEASYLYQEATGVMAYLYVAISSANETIGMLAFEHIITPRKWPKGDVDFGRSIADLTSLVVETHKKQQVINQFHEVEKKLEVMISNLPGATYRCLFDYQYTMIYISDGCIDLLGYSPEEIYATPTKELLHVESMPYAPEDEETIRLKNNEVVEYFYFITTKAGERKYLHDRYKGVFDENGNISHIDGIMTDITALKNAEDKLKQTNTELEKKVATRTADLAVALDEAKIASKTKSAFLANMSHEIRTPMNGVLGMLELLKDSALEVEQVELVDVACNSGDILISLINDILDFSKMEAGKMELDPADFNIQILLEDAARLIAEKAHKKGLELVVDIENDIPLWVKGDSVRVGQIVINLMSNAVKFTEQGQIILKLQLISKDGSDKYFYKISVIDSGIGLEEELQSKIFDSFAQADSSTSRRFGGTGLGLSICKQLVALMGGSISVDSKYGQGSVFSFQVPLQPCQNQQPEQQSSFDMSEAVVLIADGSQLSRTILDKQFEHKNITHHLARDSQQTKGLLLSAHNNNVPYDLLIVDMMLPDGDGLSLAKELRGHVELKNLPILLITSMVQGTNKRTLDEHGVSLCLTKPVRQSLLFSSVEKLLRNEPGQTVLSSDSIKQRTQKILVAEDNLVNQQVIKKMLLKLGFNVVVVEDGAAAVAAVKHNHYDMVLMDMQMPDLDGPDATKVIRRQMSRDELPIIALTANASKDDKEVCISSGMNDYLTKPIKLEHLENTMDKWFNV